MTRTAQHATEDVFSAIAHPLRRRLLDLLAEGEQPVNRLAVPFEVSRPAISQHLRVLLEVGLVSERRSGRERRYRLHPDRLGDVRDWLATYDRFWEERLSALGAHLDREPPAPRRGARQSGGAAPPAGSPEESAP
jgi:DNA-binding transcriptional ArsR family regulator